MENNPLRGLFGVSSPRTEPQLVTPQPTAPTENSYYEIPSGMIEKLLANPTTKKYTSVMIRVCHSRSRFLSCMYIHDDFMTESR